MDNQNDSLGELGALAIIVLLSMSLVLPILWWFGCFEDNPEEGKKNF